MTMAMTMTMKIIILLPIKMKKKKKNTLRQKKEYSTKQDYQDLLQFRKYR